ncbi:MAG TPA: hypothetical protein VMX94_10315 [Armatimonadota bacterium]|nr:hypothetical protein [Armatimonadota bacterium]
MHNKSRVPSAFAKETSLKLRLPRASDFAEATTDRSADKGSRDPGASYSYSYSWIVMRDA